MIPMAGYGGGSGSRTHVDSHGRVWVVSNKLQLGLTCLTGDVCHCDDS